VGFTFAVVYEVVLVFAIVAHLFVEEMVEMGDIGGFAQAFVAS